ncbi:MAG TPA: SRPBCC family protein, partial [Gammaproteobacteria bacterium]|nr:SRPBCC family protein [Gammaproteobacteria bacterium]
MPDYDFSTEWRIEAPIEEVWDQIAAPTRWPQWWPGCRQAVEIAPHREGGPGRRYRFQWRGRLPFSFYVEVELLERDRPHRLEGEVEGTLVGHAAWHLEGDSEQTTVQFRLRGNAGKPWLKRWVPMTQTLFRYNFQGLMEEGG